MPGHSQGGGLPNLAYSADGYLENLDAVLIDGILAEQGMPLHDHLTKDQVRDLADYIIFVAQSMREGKTYPETLRTSAGYQAEAWAAGLPAYLQEAAATETEAVEAPTPEPTPQPEPSEPVVEPIADDGAAPAQIVPAVAIGDAVKGERAARSCVSCHTFDKGGRQGVGPNLWGIVDRDIASIDGARYSKTLQDMDGSWDLESLDAFIKNPRTYAPGTTMGIGAPNDKKRADILAYLQTLKDE